MLRVRGAPPLAPPGRGPGAGTTTTATTTETERPATEVPTVRIAIGALLLFVADLGILHIAYGRPSIDGGLDDLRGAGGFLGAVVGGPLAAAAGDVGATVVLGGLAVVGLLLALGLSIGVVMSATARATGKAAAKARTAVGDGLGGRGIGEDVEIDDGTQRPSVFDDEAPDLAIDLIALEHEPEPDPTSSRCRRPRTEPVADAAVPAFIEAEGGQLAIAVGDDAAPHQGPWKLPPGTILKRGNARMPTSASRRRAARSSRPRSPSTASTRS